MTTNVNSIQIQNPTVTGQEDPEGSLYFSSEEALKALSDPSEEYRSTESQNSTPSSTTKSMSAEDIDTANVIITAVGGLVTAIVDFVGSLLNGGSTQTTTQTSSSTQNSDSTSGSEEEGDSFSQIDTDGDGLLSPEEFKEAFPEWNFADFDEDGDGKVSKEELMRNIPLTGDQLKQWGEEWILGKMKSKIMSNIKGSTSKYLGKMTNAADNIA